MVQVVVIGAGVMGVSTAYSLKSRNAAMKVTIIADEFSPNTCSDGSAGIRKFIESSPGQVHGMRDTPNELLR